MLRAIIAICFLWSTTNVATVALLDPNGEAAVRHVYGYDAASGRLNVVSNEVHSAHYGYLANSDLISSVTFKEAGTARLTTSKGWDYGYRLRSIRNAAGPSVISSHSYVYDALDRRTAATLHDASTWHYDYNDRSELTSGKRFWDDYTPVAGQQFEYGYDPIGNRTVARSGGNESGTGLRQTSYGANALNQYTNAINPAVVQVTGFATTPATVSVNSSPAYERGEYFHKEVTAGNGSGPVSLNVSAVASLTGTNATHSGTLIVPKANQTFGYDLDGNLTNDGIWSYEWDGENRLKSMTMTNVASVADSNRFRLEFTYDFQGRRFSKTVYNWNSVTNGFVAASTNLFIYDGWNLLVELDGGAPLDPLPLVRSYTWGLDLADSFEEAGGIGGLLVFADHVPATDTYHYPSYDGNGNVTGLVQSSGSPAALYEYSPFGELIRSTGPASRLNPFQFSTKYLDQETDLSYYGHRYYSASLGRWLNRDPIEEEDGPNVYAFVRNRPITLFDILGTTTGTAAETEASTGIGAGVEGGSGSQATAFLRQIRAWADEFNEFQQIASDVMDVLDGGDDLLIAVLEASNQNAAKARGGESAAA
jgi:RHS repeat-associated protein